MSKPDNVLIADNDIKYVHCRIMTEHYAQPLAHGGTTVAFTRAGRDGNMDIYYAAKAECSWRDNFCKKIGRSIAAGRLRKGIFDEIRTKETKMKEVANIMLDWALAK